MTRDRQDSFRRLGQLGIVGTDARALLRASATLHTWFEHECNGVIQRDDETGKPFWHSASTGGRLGPTSDREHGAIRRAKTIAGKYGLAVYVQTDPRGCAIWIYHPAHDRAGEINAFYSTIATPICS